MKIAMYSDQFFPELSGVTDTMIMTGEALRAAGHDVLYVAPRYSKKNYDLIAEDDPNSAFAKRKKLPVLRMPSMGVPGAPSNQARFVFPFGSTIRALRRFKPDVIHVHQPFGVGLEALIASRLLKIPLVGTNHSRIEQYIEAPALIKPAAVWIMRRYYSWYYSRCAFVSTPYAGLIDDMREFKLTAPAKVVPNPVLLNAFTPPTDEAQREARKQDLGVSGPVVLYVGWLSPGKRVDAVIRGIAKLKDAGTDATLVVAGQGTERKKLEALAQELGIASSVKFLGFIDPAALPPIYQAADVFAIMSVVDTQSISLMQAYASGVPAVTADAGALPDYTPETSGYVVPVDDAAALAERLGKLIGDTPLRSGMGAAAAEYVQQFSLPSITKQWLDIYHSLL